VRAAEFKATSTRKPAARDSLALRSAQATESEEASGAGLVNFGILVTATVIDPAKEADARAAVPIDLGRLTNLVGTADWIGDRVQAYRDAGITTLLAKLDGDFPAQLATLERLLGVL